EFSPITNSHCAELRPSRQADLFDGPHSGALSADSWLLRAAGLGGILYEKHQIRLVTHFVLDIGDDLADLAAEDPPAGTAVRLSAKQYESHDTVVLENLSLYGEGASETRIVAPVLDTSSSDPDALLLLASPDAELVIADLR